MKELHNVAGTPRRRDLAAQDAAQKWRSQNDRCAWLRRLTDRCEYVQSEILKLGNLTNAVLVKKSRWIRAGGYWLSVGGLVSESGLHGKARKSERKLEDGIGIYGFHSQGKTAS